MKMEGKGMGGSGFEHVVGVEGCGHDEVGMCGNEEVSGKAGDRRRDLYD